MSNDTPFRPSIDTTTELSIDDPSSELYRAEKSEHEYSLQDEADGYIVPKFISEEAILRACSLQALNQVSYIIAINEKRKKTRAVSNLRERRNVSKAARGIKELARGEVCVACVSFLHFFLSLSLSVSFLSVVKAKGDIFISPVRSLSSTKRPRLRRWLSSTMGNGALSICCSPPPTKTASSLSLFLSSPRRKAPPLQSVALFDQKVTSLSKAVDEEGKRHIYRWLSSTHENGDQSLCFFPLLGETASSLSVSSQANRKYEEPLICFDFVPVFVSLMDCRRGVIKIEIVMNVLAICQLDSSSSQATETKRPPGVQAAKGARGKKMMVEENALNEFQTVVD
ncbi:hypothetical protein F2Q69_00035179 [Brassica cretica]|uniref:Uncharacterized protein n=1 Tax=Brassica cretica TaxID=69181 RepID=A0A8S9SNC6_BRACR|nr:hypothetical protein F2Q69_00035179 [Brassica cretica]